jgi:cation diffusion facilitator CzcD-associated flavoprotein CzcO
MSNGLPKVVIVGGGFGGIETAKELRHASPLLSAAAISGRNGGPLSGRYSLADPAHSSQTEERDGIDGRGARHRYHQATRGNPFSEHAL